MDSRLTAAAAKPAFHDSDVDTDTDSPDTPTCSRGCRRVGRVGDDPRQDVGVGVGVAVGIMSVSWNAALTASGSSTSTSGGPVGKSRGPRSRNKIVGYMYKYAVFDIQQET